MVQPCWIIANVMIARTQPSRYSPTPMHTFRTETQADIYSLNSLISIEQTTQGVKLEDHRSIPTPQPSL